MGVNKFSNPINDLSMPDPFITYDHISGYYYFLYTTGNNLTLNRCHTISDFKSNVESVIIFKKGEYEVECHIWAPEIHFIDGKWRIYTSGFTNGGFKLLGFTAKTDDPFDGFDFEGILSTDEEYAIDPTIHTTESGEMYISYSASSNEFPKKEGQWGREQYLVIRHMDSPMKLGKEKCILSRAALPWELSPPYDRFPINEGAFFLKRHNRLYIIYSANGCWSDDYALGVLEYTGGSITDAKSWYKHPNPILTKGNGCYGTGHASFFTSPDGSEIWVAYHAMHHSNPDCKPTERFCHIQKISFDQNDYPVIGIPLPMNEEFLSPSGEISK